MAITEKNFFFKQVEVWTGALLVVREFDVEFSVNFTGITVHKCFRIARSINLKDCKKLLYLPKPGNSLKY